MSSNWLMFLFLLLPVAFVSGWWIAIKRNNNTQNKNRRKIHPDYFKGLNYVLDEEPDKAIEIFVKMVEVDSETIETHLALGNLFRKRGEVDRAIRIHQNLIARPTLSKEYRAQSLLELGMDYLRLGILDRAEGLFLELISIDALTVHAFGYLLDIYQQENDWDKAITTARRLETISGNKREYIIAQFYCEKALQDLKIQDIKSAKNNLKRALNLDQRCVRASIIEGDMYMKAGKYQSAINSYVRVEKQDSDYVDEIIESLQKCFIGIEKQSKFKDYLVELIHKNYSIKSFVLLADIIAEDAGEVEAIKFISDQLKIKPTVLGVDHFMNYVIPKSEGEIKNYLSLIKELTTKLLRSGSIYKCNICGFDARNIHWRCPGCKKWATIKPVELT
ncbi:MAG: lipopolysaccharide biosynthesis regulator YciM [Gammaproteobacteria bacterium]|jgi:lipopolysaccharide biosynthesis regulator YciM